MHCCIFSVIALRICSGIPMIQIEGVWHFALEKPWRLMRAEWVSLPPEIASVASENGEGSTLIHSVMGRPDTGGRTGSAVLQVRICLWSRALPSPISKGPHQAEKISVYLAGPGNDGKIKIPRKTVNWRKGQRFAMQINRIFMSHQTSRRGRSQFQKPEHKVNIGKLPSKQKQRMAVRIGKGKGKSGWICKARTVLRLICTLCNDKRCRASSDRRNSGRGIQKCNKQL